MRILLGVPGSDDAGGARGMAGPAVPAGCLITSSSYPRVCLHERYAVCDRFSPAVKTSVLWARHQSSRWLAQRLYLRPSRRSYPGARRKRPTAFYFPDVRPRVCCRRASLGDRVCSQGHPCRAGWTTAGGGIGFVNANCSISPAPACPSGIGSGRAQGQRKAGRGRPAVET
jgi:hypothetical protein